jgi:hypothetical protein
MTYTPLHLEDKVNTPDVASDLHQGYNDPLPQDARKHGFQIVQTSKKQYPYKKWKYPIDELIGKVCSS